jgi:exonuclease SbcC
MRPLKLEIEGFTAFRTPTCLNLEELDLFAITGPTGAGKSSLIDAICYALYGAVPRVTDEIASCISQGLDRMKVTLEFKTGEERYRVFRETRRKGAGNVRLDRQGGPDDWRTVAEGAREVTARVTETIGLDYNGFTRSVLLPRSVSGVHRRFCRQAPRLLRSLLCFDVYERMRGRAGAIASELNVRMTERERELQGLADATPENLKALEDALTSRRLEATRLEAEAMALSQGVELASTVWQARGRVDITKTDAAATAAELQATQSLVAGGEGDVRSGNDARSRGGTARLELLRPGPVQRPYVGPRAGQGVAGLSGGHEQGSAAARAGRGAAGIVGRVGPAGRAEARRQ